MLDRFALAMHHAEIKDKSRRCIEQLIALLPYEVASAIRVIGRSRNRRFTRVSTVVRHALAIANEDNRSTLSLFYGLCGLIL